MSPQDWQHIDGISKQMQAAAAHYGPQAWQIMCSIKQIDSLQTIVPCILIFFIALGVLIWAIHWFKTKGEWIEGRYESSPNTAMLVGGISAVASGIVMLICLGNLLYVWNWVGLFQPGLAIAHDAIVKVLGS